mmetsp:Transcript_38164/g.95259  ORF Transcript_38164/g.95259 Transcript_38164/m.95259 type:complete len:236 (+) Transcript_38164:257-964(+)
MPTRTAHTMSTAQSTCSRRVHALQLCQHRARLRAQLIAQLLVGVGVVLVRLPLDGASRLWRQRHATPPASDRAALKDLAGRGRAHLLDRLLVLERLALHLLPMRPLVLRERVLAAPLGCGGRLFRFGQLRRERRNLLLLLLQRAQQRERRPQPRVVAVPVLASATAKDLLPLLHQLLQVAHALLPPLLFVLQRLEQRLDVVHQIEQAARRGTLVAGALCEPVIADGGELLEARGG